MKNFTILFLLLPVLSSFFSACNNKKTTQSSGGNIISVEAFVAKTESVENIFRTPGNIIPAESVEIRPEISGRVIKLDFLEGTTVKKGQVLVLIDDTELQAELKQYKAQLRIAEENEKRKKELLALKGISQEEYDEALSSMEVLQASVDLTKTRIRKSKIIAPFDGRIGLRYISEGAYVQNGTIIATLAQTDMLKIEFSVPEKYAGFIKNNLDVIFTVSGSQQKYHARVYAFEPLIDESSRTLKVRAKTSNAGNSLIPGSFANITLNLERFENAVMIPTQAIIPAMNSQNVFLYKNGRMIFTQVTTGIQDDKKIQVTDGLHAGDTIAMTAILALKDNMPAVVSSIVNE